ncbi:hypothetical protein ACWGE0_11925 [Lentzea sp. NPDC054927]
MPATGLHEMRTALMTYCPGDPSDVLGAAFCATLSATMLAQPDRLTAVRDQRHELAGTADTRSRNLLSAIGALLRRCFTPALMTRLSSAAAGWPPSNN